MATVEKKIDLQRKKIAEEEKGGYGVIRVGMTMTGILEDAHTKHMRTLRAFALAGSPSNGSFLRYTWWQASCLALMLASRHR